MMGGGSKEVIYNFLVTHHIQNTYNIQYKHTTTTTTTKWRMLVIRKIKHVTCIVWCIDSLHVPHYNSNPTDVHSAAPHVPPTYNIQIQHTPPHHAIPTHTMPYQPIPQPQPTTPQHTTSYHTTPHHTTSLG